MRLRAVLLILVAAAALCALAAGGFYLLSDPERVRRTAQTSLGHALGREVRLEGAIGLQFLPMPQAVISQPRVVGADGGELARAGRIDLQLSPLALLSGRDPVSALTVVRPTLAAPIDARDLLLLASGPDAGAIRIVDGTVALRIVEGAPALTMTGLNLERGSDDGTATNITAEARDDGDGRPIRLTVRLGQADASGGIPSGLDVTIGAADQAVHFSWQGLVAPDRLFGRAQVEAAAVLPMWLGALPNWVPTAPWRAQGQLNVSADAASLTGFEAGSGAATVLATLQLDNRTRRGDARIELRGATLDGLPGGLDRWTGYEVATRLVGRDLTVRGTAVPVLELTGQLDPDGALAIERASASIGADGAAQLTEGRLVMGDQPSLTGMASIDLPTARPLLEGLVGLPSWLPETRPGSLLAEGMLHWRPGVAELAEASIRADQVAYQGRLALVGSRVELAGTVDRLDLDEWLAGPADPSALVQALPDGIAALKIGRLSYGEAWIEDVSVEASRNGGRIVVAEATAGTPEDVHLTLAGTVEPGIRAMDLVVTMDAGRPARIAALLGKDLGWLSRLGNVEGTASLRGPTDRLNVMIEAASGDRRILAAGILGSGEQAASTALRLQGEAPDLAALLGDLTLLPMAPGELRGPVAATADLSRAADGRWQASADLRAGPLQADGRLDLRLSADRPRLAGQLAFGSLDGRTVPALYDVLSTTLQFAPGSPLRWPGNWPRDLLHFGWLFGIDLDLTVRRQGSTGRTGLGNIHLENGRLDVERLDLDLPGGGRVRGSLALDGTGDVPALGLSLTLDHLESGAAGTLLGIGRAPQADLAAELELAGEGTSVAAMVDDLTGTARLALGPGTIPSPAGSEEPPFAFSSIQGELAVQRGIARSAAPHLVIDMPDQTRRYLDTALDLPVWFLDATLLPEAGLPGRHLIGPPGRLQFVEISPTDPASVPDGPDGRIPLPSADPAPAPTP